MFQTGIFAFCLFSDDYHIYIAMPNTHTKRKEKKTANYDIVKTMIATRNMFLTGCGEGSYLSVKGVNYMQFAESKLTN